MKILLKCSFTVLTALLVLSGILYAEGPDKDPFAKFKTTIERVERDCPACRFNGRTMKSNNKPSESFKDVFKAGGTCPVCGGAGVLYDEIDWTKGVVRAIGTATANPKKKLPDPKARFQQIKRMSQQGAKLEGLRNAAAALQKVRLYGDKPMPRSYYRQINVFVKGFEVKSTTFIESGTQPAAIVKVTVPIWGVQSLAGLFFDSERKRYVGYHGGPRNFRLVDAVDEDSYTEETTVVVDLRGHGFDPVLFPTIEDKDGNAVYNITTVAKKEADDHGMVRYMYLEKDEKSFEDLEKDFETGCLEIGSKNGRLVLIEVDPEGLCGETTKKKKKKKRIVIIRGKSKKGKYRSKIIISGEDAKKMSEAEKKGGAKKKGNLVIISDSRIAGKQGMVIEKTEKRFVSK